MAKMKLSVLFLMGMTLLFMGGCSTKRNSLYYYGDYSESYYATKKEASDENTLAFQKAIEESIAEKDDSRSGRVAPGMYANLGYLYLKAGNNQKAIENFQREKAIYPEATIFMDRMINKVKVLEGNSDDK